MTLRIQFALLLTAVAAIAGDPTVAERLAGRTFPSVFQAWNGAAPETGKDDDSLLTRHDLAFVGPATLKLVQEGIFEGTSHRFTPASVTAAKAQRAKLLTTNPHLILLVEIRYRDAPKGFLPEDSPWWKRDGHGEFVMGWAEGGYRLLDVANTNWHEQVAVRAKALIDTGVFDGVMFDWWIDDEARLSLIQRVRNAIGDGALILANANDHSIPQTAPYINGLFMECYRSQTPADWQRIGETLRWAETHLRAPRINCVETWWHQSRADLPLMRAVTTLTLTQSDGYCLFSDPNDLPSPDHQHAWYDFWNKGLGQPKQAGQQRPDGAWERAFTSGMALYNPAGNSNITVQFSTALRSRATGRTGTEHPLPANDGDLFLKE